MTLISYISIPVVMLIVWLLAMGALMGLGQSAEPAPATDFGHVVGAPPDAEGDSGAEVQDLCHLYGFGTANCPPGFQGTVLVAGDLVLRPIRECDPRAEATVPWSCESADVDGDTVVGALDHARCVGLGKREAAACAGLVQAWWNVECGD